MELQLQWRGIVATDSQSLLDTLFGRDELGREKDRDEPVNLSGSCIILDCLAPDWEFLIEIQETLSKLPDISLLYVKGHQDRNRRYKELDEIGQLNVDADAKAREYQEAHGAEHPSALMTTATRAHLLAPKGTITGQQYTKFLRYQATAPALREYIQTKYAWSESTMNSVNWDAHRAALGKMYKRRTHFTKLVFNILPTNSQLNKFDNGQRRCPSCSSASEDRDHVLRYLARRRVTWRIEFMESMTDFYRRAQTDMEIQMLLRVGFGLVLNNGFRIRMGRYNFNHRKSFLRVSNRLSSNKITSGGDRSLTVGLVRNGASNNRRRMMGARILVKTELNGQGRGGKFN